MEQVNERFKFGKLNIYVGLVALLLAGFGGLGLGFTFDQYAVKGGEHVLALSRFYLREGHSHGMPIAIYNLVIGLLVDRWLLLPKACRACSIAAALGIVLPLGLAAKGAAGAPADFPPVGMIGVLGLIVSVVVLLVAKKRTAA